MDTKNSNLEERVQQYNLRWTNYINNILQGFSEQLNSELLTDVTFACEGRFLKAHKMILSTCSIYFQQLFQIYTVPNPLIIMNGVRFDDLKQVVQFMYHGEVKINENDIDPVLALAENLQVKGLCSVRTNNMPESSFPEKPSESTGSQNKKRRYSYSSISETVTSEDSVFTEETDSVTKRDEPVILPPRVPEVPIIANINAQSTSPRTQEAIDYNNKAFKKLHLKMSALPSNVDASVCVPTPSPETQTDQAKSKTNSRLICGIAMKIPRPPNAFMVFANEWRKRIANKYPSENNKDISVRLGNIWKSLPMDTKMLYYKAAKEAEKEHKSKYPGYIYSPKEARKRKEVKGGTKRPNGDPVDLKSSVPESNCPSEDLTCTIEVDEDEVEFVQSIKEEPRHLDSKTSNEPKKDVNKEV